MVNQENMLLSDEYSLIYTEWIIKILFLVSCLQMFYAYVIYTTLELLFMFCLQQALKYYGSKIHFTPNNC